MNQGKFYKKPAVKKEKNCRKYNDGLICSAYGLRYMPIEKDPTQEIAYSPQFSVQLFVGSAAYTPFS